MAASNSEIARLFTRFATLLEIQGANPFRVRAYHNAARLVQEQPKSVAEMLAAGYDLTELEGIGKDLAGKMREIVETHGLTALDELEQDVPGALAELTTVPGLGPKRVKRLYDELGIRTTEDLERAARSGRIRQMAGFGEKTEAKIAEALAARRGREQRVLWLDAERAAAPLVEMLRGVKGVHEVDVAGSFRRARETVGDLDLLAVCATPERAIDALVDCEDVAEVASSGTTRATVYLRSGLQVDLRVVPAKSYGAALLYFTGSKAHNIELRRRAIRRGFKLNEYGLLEGETQVAGRTEREIYRKLGLAYIEPELREARGEIAAAEAGKLPKLVTVGDLRGDLHAHTDATDGHDSLEAMARGAEALGYEYLAITDHTRRLTIANGLDPKRLRAQLARIDKLNGKLKSLRLLKSAEVDILEDGSLDLPDGLLGELDLVVGAVHSGFELSKRRQTERIIHAMDHPSFSILAHPSGRLLGEREPYAVDIEKLLRAAGERGCHLEINAQPRRLDLADTHAHLAKQLGVKLAISTDAHSVAQLGQIRLGVAQARRGWLEPEDVLNTRSRTALMRLLKRR